MAGYVAVVDKVNGTETVYDMYTLEPISKPVVEVVYDIMTLTAAKNVVEIVGVARKIPGIKIIRAFTLLGLQDAKVLWELAEKMTRNDRVVPF